MIAPRLVWLLELVIPTGFLPEVGAFVGTYGSVVGVGLFCGQI